MGTEDTGLSRPLPGPQAPSEGEGRCFLGLLGASLKQAPHPTRLPPPLHTITSFGFRDYRIREVMVIPCSRWLTTAKPLHQF